LPPHFRCAVHKLSLVATKDSSLALSDKQYKKIYRSLHGKLVAIWNKQSTSVLASDKIRAALGKLFVVPNDTRWNSTFDALTSVNELLNLKKMELTSLFIAFDLRPMNDTEQKFLQEFLNTMKPLAYAIDILQGEVAACAGYLLPTLANIQEEWNCLQASGIVYCEQLLQNLRKGLGSRFEDELKSTEFQVAASLHPKFRLHWVSSHEKHRIIGEVKKALSAFETPLSVINDTPNTTDTNMMSKDSFFWRFEKRAKMNEPHRSVVLGNLWLA